MRTLIRSIAIAFILGTFGLNAAFAQTSNCGSIDAEQLRGKSDSTAIADAQTLLDCASQQHELGNNSQAISYLKRANSLADTPDTRAVKLDILLLLHSCHAATGNYREAYSVSLKLNERYAESAAARGREVTRMAMSLQKEREAARQAQMETLERQQELQFLQSENDRTQMRLDVSDGWLERERIRILEEKQARELLERDRQIQAGRILRETLIRNVLIGAAFVALIIGFLIYRRLKDHRRTSEMKAEIAEARASALESEKRQHEFESRKRFTRQLIDSQEQERKRIAADLHDGLGQDLLVIKNRLTLARREHEKGKDPTGEMQEILLAVNSSLQNIRSISRNLRPSQLDRIGLTSSVESMLNTLQDSCSFALRYSVDDIDRLFSKEREIDVYRIIQEGLNNVIKHAQADTAVVEVARLEAEVKITVSDDGQGFYSTDSDKDNRQQAVGFGLQGMNERVQILGGILSIDSSPGEGTKVTVLLPVKHRPETTTH